MGSWKGNVLPTFYLLKQGLIVDQVGLKHRDSLPLLPECTFVILHPRNTATDLGTGDNPHIDNLFMEAIQSRPQAYNKAGFSPGLLLARLHWL